MDNIRSAGDDARVAESPLAWKTRDFVVAGALAVPFGLLYAGWLLAWSSAPPELAHFLAGFYVIAGVLASYIIRRPGAALVAEIIGAIVEYPLSPYGVSTLILGVMQAVGTEAVFAFTGYRRYGTGILMLAGAVGSLVVLFGWWYLLRGYADLSVNIQVIRFVATVLGSALFGGLLAKLIGDALAKTGVLNNFPIARGHVREI